MSDHAGEIKRGERFGFGGNWSNYLRTLNDERIAEAETSLVTWLGSMKGKRFLDIGSGSGLFSLCARRLGAEVRSFDYDPDSIDCTKELRRRYFADDPNWTVAAGSVLDRDYMDSLGRYDIVYSWGVLHHTGSMWEAIENAQARVAPGGFFFIAIYNDQGLRSRLWAFCKKVYNRLPPGLRPIWTVVIMGPHELARFLHKLVQGKPQVYWQKIRRYRSLRGMSYWHDMIDWIGGYPFEVAKPEEIFDYMKARGFSLEKLSTCGGRPGCNQYVFSKTA